MRDKKALKMTSKYTHEEQRVFKSFPNAPTPRGTGWRQYIVFKLKVFARSLETYTRRKYNQLALHHYIEWNRTMDNVANRMTDKQASVIYFGDAKFPADSPIGLKGKKRSPGERKLVVSLKKSGKNDVKYTPEAYTSQTCPHCKRRFEKKTKPHRYKVCRDCPGESVATWIVTDRSRRRRQRDRKQIAAETGQKSRSKQQWRAKRSMRHREERRAKQPERPNDTERKRKRRERRRKLRQRRVVAGRRHIARHRERSKKYNEEGSTKKFKRFGVARVSNDPRPQPNDSGLGELGSKNIVFEKTWHSNPTNEEFGHANQEQRPARTIVFHRDIVAALCILYVGKYTKNLLFVVVFQLFVYLFVSGRCLVFGWTVHESFILAPERRRPSIRAKQPKPQCRGVAVASDAA